MPNKRLRGPRVSALAPSLAAGRAGAPVNQGCHGNLDGVEPNDRVILANVRVMLLFWGKFYEQTPDAVTNAFALCRDLVTGPYFNGLAQYGVGRGSMAGTANLNFDPPPATLSLEEAEQKLREWLGGVGASFAPRVDEDRMLYVLFPPPETKPTIESGADDFCGYHHWTKLHDASRESDIFWALIRTDTADRSSGATFAHSVSYCVSHEIAEAVTSRDGRGFHKGACEIGDLCEQIATHDYRGWQVEQYWSEDDRRCINGEDPVSVRRFLARQGLHGGSLRALHAPTINVELVATRSR